MGLLLLVLVTSAVTAIALSPAPSGAIEADAAAGGSRQPGTLFEAYEPVGASVAGLGSDCCNHVAAYEFKLAALGATSGL